jgi:hypothetical protein
MGNRDNGYRGKVCFSQTEVFQFPAPALRFVSSKTLIEILNITFRLVQSFDIVVALVDSKTGHLVLAALFDELALPAWIVAGITCFDIQTELW